MTAGSLQSRKICFVEAEDDDRAFFAEILAGHDVDFFEGIKDVPADVEILSVFISHRIDESFLEAHPALKLICSRSTGYEHIDVGACQARGIQVTNVGSYGESTVAEHTFALLLALSRRLRDSEQAIHSGHFSREQLQGFDLRGRTLGVIGAGRVGLHVIRIASGFGMKVLAYDDRPHPFFGELLDYRYVTLEELLRSSDVLTLHVPLTPATRDLINKDTLALCRPGVFIINTARGGLINTADVIEALDRNHVAGLGLDVMEDERVFQGGMTSVVGEKIVERLRSSGSGSREPSRGRLVEFSRLVENSQLLHRSDVILTPHVAYNSAEANERLRTITIENISCYLEGKPLKHLCQ